MIKKMNQKGFTIVELLIATSVFATVLFIVTYGIIQISRMYTNGFIQTQTQNTAISISDQITKDLEFSSASVNTEKKSSSENYYYFCTTQNEYYYQPLGGLSEISLAYVNGGQCASPTASPSFINSPHSQNLLSTSMEILNHSSYDNQDMLTGNSGLYTVGINVLYGNQTNLEYNSNTNQFDCRPTVLVGPFCAIYNLNTQDFSQN